MLQTLRAMIDEHQTLVAALAWVSGVTLVVSLIALPVVAVLLPTDFLQRAALRRDLPADDWRRRHPVVRWTLRILKNIAGIVLALAGLAMLVLPGQGLLTLALALLLLDVPGKRRLENRLLRSTHLLRLLNRLRQTFSCAPLIRPEQRGSGVGE